jgi:hypothetical protein
MFHDAISAVIAVARPDQLADDIADRIAIASPGPELDDIVRAMWCDHTHGLLTTDDMEALDEAVRARREAIQERRSETRPTVADRFPAHRPGFGVHVAEPLRKSFQKLLTALPFEVCWNGASQ